MLGGLGHPLSLRSSALRCHAIVTVFGSSFDEEFKMAGIRSWRSP